MRKNVILFLILTILFLQSCSLFNFQEKDIINIIENKKQFNISLKNNTFVASKRFRIPFNIYISNTVAATPFEIIDKIKIIPETKNATVKIYKNSLDFINLTKSGTYTITFYHSNISTSLTLKVLPDKPKDIKLELSQKVFFASEKILIPLKIYYTDIYGNKIIKNFKNISLFPYVKNDLKKIDDENYELTLYNITKPGKYLFTLHIENTTSKSFSFKIIPSNPNKILFENSIIYLATNYEDNTHFPPKKAKIKYSLLDNFDNETKVKKLSFKIVSNNFLKPTISIENDYINIISNIYPGKYLVEFYYNEKKLDGHLEINVVSVPRKIIFVDKIINSSLYLTFSIQDGNTNTTNNIEISKIIIKAGKTEILINDKLKKYIYRRGNLFIFGNYPLDTYFNNIEITFYVKSKTFNYTKKITEKIY
ncbi:hypothetical protein SAMN02745164_00866 [Marinitoga hydrogenitolerans DSM 16785]|uniref:Uncharacterized protein n=1 Tax=Marinitoga hydrogenitolerans (strain DSM 16785 / JCM 12826 / AT1271) TaxID=1122195 RepID=A0A1M4V8T7_MARH1|nr:hypothetical protein [Marinitoga hydrogenitolerans]SHE65342.1 hypothetical protein SAMN02745164_00866 [Marinitoga hydrogenitolerans DSM 16785]